MGTRDIIVERECDSDEKGLFLSLPISQLHRFLDESNSVRLHITGNSIDHSFGMDFNCVYNRDVRGFLTSTSSSKDQTYFFKGEDRIIGKYISGLRVVYSSQFDSILFFDAFFYIDSDIDDINFSEFKFIPFHLSIIEGNHTSGNKEYQTTDFNQFIISVDPLTHLIHEIISPRDCCYSSYRQIIIRNDDERLLNIFPKIKDAKELVGNFYYIDNEFIHLSTSDDRYRDDVCSLFDIREQIASIRRIQLSINKTAIFNRLFENYEDISEIQNEKRKKDDIIYNTKNQIFKNQIDLYMKRKDLCVSWIKEFEKSHNYKYQTSVCLLIKDENEFLEEWLDNYYNLGIEHFFIYDNNSKIPIVKTLECIRNGFYIDKCDVILFTEYNHMQYDCYENCLKRFGDISKWIGFFDTDELLEFTDNSSNINDFLQRFDADDISCVWIPWQLYNANGHISKPNGGMRENYTSTIIDPFGLYGKVFVRTSRTMKVWVHNADSYNYYFQTVDPSGNYLYEIYRNLTINAFKGEYIYPHAKINHYITRSFNEWCEKMARGTCDPNFKRKFDVFFEYNPDLRYLQNETNIKGLMNTDQPYI